MESTRIKELVNASRNAAFLRDPVETVRELDQAIARVTDPGQIGHLLLARAVARQGASDITPAARDSRASVDYLLAAGELSAAAFAMACAAGMAQRTGDMAGAVDLAVAAMVQLPDHDLNDEYLVRASNAMSMLFVQFSAFDLAISASSRAFAGAMNQDDLNTRSVTAYTLGYCAVEGIRSGQLNDAQHAEFEVQLNNAIGGLDSAGSASRRTVLGTGMHAEQILLRHLDTDELDADSPLPESDQVVLRSALSSLEEAAEEYPHTAPRLAGWHRLVTATVLRNLGQPERAEAMLDEAVVGLAESGDEHRIIRAINERSTARAMMGNLEGALADARQAATFTRHWQQYQGARLAVQISRRAELEQARSQLRRRADDLAKQAAEDHVTGLSTRRWLEVQLDATSRLEGKGTVVVLDLDRFKAVNDTFGHQTGDAVLREVGSMLRGMVREGTTVARFGGEEFVILLTELEASASLALAERIRVAINTFDWNSVAEGLAVTISAGVAHGPLANVRELMRLADSALYEAKRAGRDRVISA